ncbi:MAG: hypothetical protein U9Q69_02390 [Nanoarchaeota archaeon]|nr:hypothetical protein [Nanoarchaeota archaeon]
MVKNKKLLFLRSAIITLIVFGTGILLGVALDNYKENSVLTDLKFNELDTQSYFLEEAFIKDSEKNICEILQSRIDNLKHSLIKIGTELRNNEVSSISKSSDLDYLKRKYTLSEVQFLMLLKDLKKDCNSKYIPILFFYTKDEPVCMNQGYILTWAYEKYKKNVVVLSFDKDYEDEPLIKTLKLQYGVQEKSTVVIDGKTYSTFLTKEELNEILTGLIPS